MSEEVRLGLAQELNTLIQSDYLGKRFSTSAFTTWVHTCLEKAADLSPNRAYHCHKLLKKIRQEAYPLSIFMKSGLLPIHAAEPSQDEYSNFDARIFLADGSECFVEVTCVKDGQFDLFQGEHSDKFGFAGITGVSTEEMSKAIKEGVPNIGAAVDAPDTITECISNIQRRISMKIEKPYTPGTILLVAIQDDFRKRTFELILSDISIPRQTTFTQIFIVSTNSKNCGQLF